MAKQFKITVSSSGSVQEFTAKQYMDALYEAQKWADAYGFDQADEHVACELKGTQVSCFEFISACNSGFDAWLENKQLTHKKVKCLNGSSVLSYV